MTRIDRRRRQAPPKRYRTLSNFYAGDRRRIRSRELDVGLWWRERAGGPLHRAAWIKDTGELYLAHLGPPEQGGGGVEVLAKVADRERLESALAGWREQCGGPRSLQWLRLRALRLADRREDCPEDPLRDRAEDRPREETRLANLRRPAPGRARPTSPRSEMPILAGRSFD